MDERVKTARLSIISNSSLIIMKLIVGVITGSVSILSEAIHSTMDLAASIISFFSVRISSKPADKEHPYGHGKFEDVSGVLESILIFTASIFIIIEASKRLLSGKEIGSSTLGFLIMFLSAIINFFVSKKLYKVAEKNDSIALKADALHLRTDVYSSLGVGVGLFLIWITNLHFLDPLVAIFIALFILKEAFNLLKTAFDPLVDVKLSDDEISIITNAISKYSSGYCGFHKLRTRKSGNKRYVDLHLVFPGNMHMKRAHDICNNIEAEMSRSLENTEVMIHLESCDNDCINCGLPNKSKCKNR
ncbi:cation diffusion facilitator family transporter [Clostridium sp. Mt-5]|uniref:Cation diffusion facilitator family transporter n=1 Tax=Clostridium moutaii TaxID=3240932 RepID=A0ABV4BRS4_9CLOT